MCFWSIYKVHLHTHVHAYITLDTVSTPTNLFAIYQCHILQFFFSLGDYLFGILHSMGKLFWVHTDYSMLKDIVKYFPLIHFHSTVFLKIHPFLPWPCDQTTCLHRNLLLSWHICLASLFSSCNPSIVLLPKWSSSAVLLILPSSLSEIPQAPVYVVQQIPTCFPF